MWPGNAPKRSLFRRADDEFQRRIDREDTIAMEACPGPGRCHGQMSWCDDCGDVDDVCNAIRCDRHRCARCLIVVRDDYGDNWFKLCKECHDVEKQLAMDRAVDHAVDRMFPGIAGRAQPA